MPWPLPERAVLGLFAKRPEPGRVKTRLAAAFGPEFAARAHEAMLFDTLDLWASDRVLTPGGRRVLVFDPPDAGNWFDSRVPESFALQPQSGGDLGARLQTFIQGEFEDGATAVVVLGTDSPTLDPHFVVSAFLALERRDVVLGPATDGGYYLVGCRPPLPAIFEGIDWSTSSVLAQTVDRLQSANRPIALLPPWYDIDTPDDWQALVGHLRAMRLAGMDLGMPRTELLNF
jgi:rSAM/selenodomain-associated transferase 1